LRPPSGETPNKFGPPYPFNGGCHEFFNKVFHTASLARYGKRGYRIASPEILKRYV
jgi:hypothetical protein